MKHSLSYYFKLPVSTYWNYGVGKLQSILFRLLPQYGTRKSIQKFWDIYKDYPLNLDSPQTFCEKLQWLKLHDHNPIYHKWVDKYEAKMMVSKLLGEKYVAKLYAVYNNVDEIDFDKLPQSFVLKCTHDSGGIVICPNKSELDKSSALRKLRNAMKYSDYSQSGGQWAYGHIKPRIIAEEYIDSLSLPDSIEYKITCIYGKVKMITICTGVAHDDTGKWFNDHFDRDGNRLPFHIIHGKTVHVLPAGTELPEKPILQELIHICEILSKEIPQVRVDLYVHKGHVMFGEMSFYTWSGYMTYVPQEWDKIMGDWLDLSVIDKRYPFYQK